jgi:hypothetical protein
MPAVFLRLRNVQEFYLDIDSVSRPSGTDDVLGAPTRHFMAGYSQTPLRG